MAEVAGLVASIIGITQLTGKLASVGYGYISGVKGAPKEIRQLADELSSFKTVLDNLQRYAIENAQSPGLQVLSSLNGPLQECTEHLHTLQPMLLKLEFQKKGWRTLWRNLKWPLKESETLKIISLVERQKNTLTAAISTHQLILSQVIKTGIEETHALVEDIQNDTDALKFSKQEDEVLRIDLTRRTVLNWLYSKEYDSKHLEIRGKRQENTGQWLLKSQGLLNWGKDQDSRLLWGHGIPGAGKTFLSSLVIDDLEERALAANYGVAYIYFDFKEQDQQDAIQVLASLAKQLAYQIPQLPIGIKTLYDRLSPQNKKPTLEELYDILLVTFGSFLEVYLIFDALDECNPGELRTQFLPLFHRMAKDHANVFMTSRPHPTDIQYSFKYIQQIELLAQDEDIETYVQKRIDENPTAKTLIRQGKCEDKIITGLIDCAKGMFLLVRFHIDYICQQTTANQILNILDQLKHSPPNLDLTYDRVVQTICGQPKNRADLALRVLTWIVKAREPLTVDEIQVAVSVEQNRYELGDLDLPDGQMLLDVCASLVMIDGGKVRLAHYTVQEYIIAKAILPSDANFKVAMACITYLSFDKAVRVSEQPHPPFFDYAAFNLTFHLKACDEDLTRDMVLYFINRSESMMAYLETLQTDKRLMDNGIWHSNPNTLQGASILGHRAAVLLLLKEGANIRARDSKKYTALHLAAGYGNTSVVQLLLERGASISAKNIEGWTALHVAAYRQDGHELVVRLLLEKGAQISATTYSKETPLHLAADCGNEAVVLSLLKWHGCNVLAVDSLGNTSLHNATWSKDITKLLIENGADVLIMNNDEQTALHSATRMGAVDVVELLLEKGADIAVMTPDGWTTLHIAAGRGHQAVVVLLLEKGADTTTTTPDGWTALHLAAQNGHKEVVVSLLEKGADIAVTAPDGWTTLHIAAGRGHQAVVVLLLEKGADTAAMTPGGFTALHLAAQNGHKEVVVSLLGEGADTAAAMTPGGWTALHLAAQNGHKEVVVSLLEKGADTTAATTPDGFTALHLAAQHGHKEVVVSLLEKGADIAVTTPDGWTTLHIAAGRGHQAVIVLLLEKGADTAATTPSGFTALHLAAENDHKEVVVSLLEKSADTTAATTPDGWTALHLAAQNGHKEVVVSLLEKGANTTAATAPDGFTALHLAAENDHKEVVVSLLEKGADTAATTPDGWTALHLAAQHGHKEVVVSLLEKDADTTATTPKGFTALHLAAQNGHKKVVVSLLEKGADITAKTHFGSTALEIAISENNLAVTRFLQNAANPQ